MVAKVLTLTLISLLFASSTMSSSRPATTKLFTPQTTRNCAALERPDIVINPSEVLAKRVPTDTHSLVSGDCQSEEQAAIARWNAEDLKDFERLANQLCSAKIGYVEKIPGTCNAGGPPPICKADHWKPGDSQTAMANWEAMGRAIAAEREKQLIRQMCGYKKRSLEKEEEQKASGTSSQVFGGSTYNGSGSAIFTCPPGTVRQQDGSCRAPTIQKATNLQDALKLIKQTSNLIHNEVISGSYSFSSKEMAFSGTPSISRQQYVSHAGKLANLLELLGPLLAEREAARDHKPSAPSLEAVERRIAEMKSNMAAEVEWIKLFSADVIKTPSNFGKYGCPEVFQHYHQSLLRKYTAINLLPDKLTTFNASEGEAKNPLRTGHDTSPKPVTQPGKNQPKALPPGKDKKPCSDGKPGPCAGRAN
jgi:hypothetical protein